jgi:hypothetical protein
VEPIPLLRMPSSGVLHRVALVRTKRRKTSDDGILHSHRRETLKSYESTITMVIYWPILPALDERWC